MPLRSFANFYEKKQKMLHKTKGICINFLKYKETSIIAKIYTQEFGLQSYLVNSVRTQKPKFSVAFFQPLTLLDMVVYHKTAKNTLRRIAEVRCSQPYKAIPFDIKKSSLVVFLSEILLKVLQEDEKNEELFEFLEQSFLLLDKLEQIENFVLIFLVHLLENLGLLGRNTEKDFFKQLHQAKACPHPQTIPLEVETLDSIRKGRSPAITAMLRQKLVDYLLAYFRLHYDSFGEVKSLHIFRDLFSKI